MPRKDHRPKTGTIKLCKGSGTALSRKDHWFLSVGRFNVYCDECREKQARIYERIRVSAYSDDPRRDD